MKRQDGCLEIANPRLEEGRVLLRRVVIDRDTVGEQIPDSITWSCRSVEREKLLSNIVSR